MQLLTSRHSARLGVAIFFLITFTASGCGSKAGKVNGTVTFDGRPLPAGQITFKGTDKSVTANIVDGKYTIEAPLGPCKVGVQTDYLLGSGVSANVGPSDRPDFSQVPADKRREVEEKYREEGADVAGKSKEDAAKRRKDAENYVEIPESYNDPEMSGLTVTVGKGTQDAPAFELKSPPGWQPTKKAQAQGGAGAGGMGPGGMPGGMPPGGMPPGGMPPGGMPPGGMPPGGKPPGVP
jgi:hypothetical protein